MRRRLDPRATCALSGLPWVLLLVFGCARGADDRARAAAAAPAEPVVLAGAGTAVAQEHVPALEALSAAVVAGDDVAAQAILARLLARGPKGKTLELALGFQRILDGRASAAALRMHLECGDVPDARGSAPADAGAATRLWLVVESRLDEPLVLRPGPATLSVQRHAVDARGNEQASAETHTFEVEDGTLSIGPREVARAQLGDYAAGAVHSALASRIAFELELRAGVVVRAGRELPVQNLRVAGTERVRTAAVLEAAGPAEPGALVEHVKSGRVERLRALALAVRIAPEQREATLAELAPYARDLSEPALQALVPALRWLAPRSVQGGDPQAWRAWLRARSNPKTERPRLQLPPPGSPAPAPVTPAHGGQS